MDDPHNSPGERSWYVDDHVDEGWVPASTLPEWATYLANWRDDSTGETYPDGAAFDVAAKPPADDESAARPGFLG